MPIMPAQTAEAPLSARELILTLMDSTRARALTASYLIAAAQLFDMDPGSVRVALARLMREGSLIGAGRGRYALGSRAGTLHTLVQNWSRAEQSLVEWQGDWLTVLVGHLARSNKSVVRGNERALSLFGFAEMAAGIWVRPANLARSLDQVRADLLELGLVPGSLCARVSELAPAESLDPNTLWQTEALERRYREDIRRLAESMARLTEMDDSAAARETLLLGREVTRHILLDPMLPGALVDAGARREMIESMRDYDRLGKAYWREFYNRHGDGPAQNPAA
jgi:phenylacetic acid degradation operon negative regulatory protein